MRYSLYQGIELSWLLRVLMRSDACIRSGRCLYGQRSELGGGVCISGRRSCGSGRFSGSVGGSPAYQPAVVVPFRLVNGMGKPVTSW